MPDTDNKTETKNNSNEAVTSIENLPDASPSLLDASTIRYKWKAATDIVALAQSPQALFKIHDDLEVIIDITQKGPLQPNDTVSGTVTLEVKKEKMTRGILIHCIGDAEVKFLTPKQPFLSNKPWHWQFYKKNKVSPANEFYISTETYIDYWKYILGGTRIREVKLTPGTQIFPFSFKLPNKLVCSYSSEHGRVKYKIQVKIKGFGEGTKDEIYYSTFQVFAPLDLNDFLGAFKPKAVAAKKVKKILKAQFGLIGFVFEVPHGGLIIGDTVDFNGELINTTTDWTVSEVKISLVQSDIFTANGELTWTKKVIYELTYPGVDNGHIDLWEGQFGPIPVHLLPTNLSGCKIIHVTYWILVSMTYKKAGKQYNENLTEIGEIILGNIPYDNDLMEKTIQKGEKERVKNLIRSGLRYRASEDQIIGDGPILSYFANYSEQAGGDEKLRRAKEVPLHHLQGHSI